MYDRPPEHADAQLISRIVVDEHAKILPALVGARRVVLSDRAGHVVLRLLRDVSHALRHVLVVASNYLRNFLATFAT